MNISFDDKQKVLFETVKQKAVAIILKNFDF